METTGAVGLLLCILEGALFSVALSTDGNCRLLKRILDPFMLVEYNLDLLKWNLWMLQCHLVHKSGSSIRLSGAYALGNLLRIRVCARFE
jgi:hypothetical protein